MSGRHCAAKSRWRVAAAAAGIRRSRRPGSDSICRTRRATTRARRRSPRSVHIHGVKRENVALKCGTALETRTLARDAHSFRTPTRRRTAHGTRRSSDVGAGDGPSDASDPLQAALEWRARVDRRLHLDGQRGQRLLRRARRRARRRPNGGIDLRFGCTRISVVSSPIWSRSRVFWKATDRANRLSSRSSSSRDSSRPHEKFNGISNRFCHRVQALAAPEGAEDCFDLAVKVYKTSILVFRDRERYVRDTLGAASCAGLEKAKVCVWFAALSLHVPVSRCCRRRLLQRRGIFFKKGCCGTRWRERESARASALAFLFHARRAACTQCACASP